VFNSNETKGSFAGYAIPCDIEDTFFNQYGVYLDEFNGYEPGTLIFVEYDDSSGSRLDCVGDVDLSTCLASPAYMDYFAFYEMTGEPPPDPGPDPEIMATSSVDQTQRNVTNIIFAFFAAFMSTVWLLRSRN